MSPKIRVAALTGGRNKPSSRYRVRQHVAPLAARGVEVCEVVPVLDKHWDLMPADWQFRHPVLRRPVKAAQHVLKAIIRAPGFVQSWRSQATWLQRELLPGMPSIERVLRPPLVFDVDDAIWLAPPAGTFTCRKIAQWSAVVIAGNEYLAEWFQPHADRIEIIPTAVDTDRWAPAPARKDGRFTLGWIGTRPSLRYVASIQSALAAIMADHRDVELVVCCDRPPELPDLPADRVRFVPWSRETELATVQSMDVGIMPLIDEPWVYGKCSFKMLQYMACGVPVVVTPLGMNAQVLQQGEVGYGATSDDEWVDALRALHADRAHGRALGSAGRKVVETHYARSVVADQIARVFASL